MKLNSQLLRSEQHVKIGLIIQRDAEILIDRWAQRAVWKQPNAARVHHKVFLDRLPRLLQTVGQNLAARPDVVTAPPEALVPKHGEQRWEAGWSLTEVVRDYQILRCVLFEHLEETLHRSLDSREGQTIDLTLDEAIAASITACLRQRDDYAQRLERERDEHRCHAEEMHLCWERVFQTVGWGIALLRPSDNTFQSVNPAYARQHGYTVEELIGQPLSLLFPPESRNTAEACLQEADGAGYYVYESDRQRKDGSRFPVLAQTTSITDSSGTVRYRTCTFQDISVRKQMERMLREQAEALKESDQHKNAFLAFLAHELRNLLAPIRTSVELFRLLDSPHAYLNQACTVLERQVKQMVRLVDDLLDLTRIARGKLELRRTLFAVGQAVTQAVQTVQPLLEAQKHRLSIGLPAEPILVEADETRIVQVLANLLGNAAKYTEGGGQISITAAREGEEAVLRVRDNGMGIEAEQLGRIFDMFMQVDRSRHRSQGGLGIGLALVRQLVEQHGGRLSVHSDGPGMGSEFTVRLPAASPHPSQSAALDEIGLAQSAAMSYHILVIEDNEDARETLAMLLQTLGHRTETAATGPEGVNRALASRPQVVLIDLGLPGLDGFQVNRQIRAALGKSVRLVALTGYAQEEDRQRSRDAGFDAHLSKPVELEELNAALNGG